MRRKSVIFASIGFLSFFLGCASTPPQTPFDAAAFQANRTEVAKNFTDTGKTGIFKESKKVLLPEFKVYFQTKASMTSKSGNAFSEMAGKKTAQVRQRVNVIVDPKAMQELTDKLYEDFVKDLASLGYEVLDPKKISAEFEEFKKYYEGDKMVSSPANINDTWLAFAPTGWKLEHPEVDIGMPGVSAGFSAFSTTLNDVMGRAMEKMKAIRMSPQFALSAARISDEGGATYAAVKPVQGVRVMINLTTVRAWEGWNRGHVTLRSPVISDEEVGKFVAANELGDSARNVLSAVGSSLFGMGANESHAVIFEANTAKFKQIAGTQLQSARELMMERLKTELN